MVKNYLILLSLALCVIFKPTNVYAEEKAFASSAVLTTPQKNIEEDNRAQVLKQFLHSYNSPLEDHAETFVREADANNLDWRLLVAISGVESTFAHQMPEKTHNAWGWGIYGDNMIYFKSYDEAIETISKSLRENYMDKWGTTDVYRIGRYYAASPTWAQRVVFFMSKIDEYQSRYKSKTLSISL